MTDTSLNRQEIMQIAGDPPTSRKIRALESMFQEGSTESDESRVELGTVDAKVNQAVGSGIDTLRRVKGANVLLWLSM